jgi:uncharacterized protein YkwD
MSNKLSGKGETLLFRLIAGFLTVAVLAVGSPAPAAAEGFLSAPVKWSLSNIYLDGQLVKLQDAAGDPVRPYIRGDGVSAYLPLRATAEAFGWTVGWDAVTGGVNIDTKGTQAVFPASEVPNSYVIFNESVFVKDVPVSLNGQPIEMGANLTFVLNSVLYLSVSTWAHDIWGLEVDTTFRNPIASGLNVFLQSVPERTSIASVGPAAVPGAVTAPALAVATTAPATVTATATVAAGAALAMELSGMNWTELMELREATAVNGVVNHGVYYALDNYVFTAEEYKEIMLEAVWLTNIERVKAWLNELEVLPELMDSARAKAEDFGVHGFYSHFRAPHTSYMDMMWDTIATYWPSGKYIGENGNQGSSTPARAIDSWMNSEGHRRNILNPKHKYIGIGAYRNPGAAGFSYWVMHLGY